MSVYIVAVSGGVDSVVLLHMLINKAEEVSLFHDSTFIVAHYDHGIRHESKEDRMFVQDLAKNAELKFEYEEGSLGKNASEELARDKRYHFLRSIKATYNADAIITAHHLDDKLETAIINIIRGTGPRGLISLKDTALIRRPLLSKTKKQLLEYAHKNNLEWKEDSTNSSTYYLRNYIRKLLATAEESKKNELISLIDRTGHLYSEIDNALPRIEDLTYETIILLPHTILGEMIASTCRNLSVIDYSSRTIDRLSVFIKVSKIGARTDVDDRWWLVRTKSGIQFSLKN